MQRHARNAADEIIEAAGAVDAVVDITATTGATDTENETETEVEARHRRAAERGDLAAMSALGALLLRRGDLDGAEPYLRGATAEGDRAAANNLGVLPCSRCCSARPRPRCSATSSRTAWHGGAAPGCTGR